MSPRRGRRPGDPEVTRRAILEAARTAFAEAGYEQATIRSIATLAGVDPALVHHHFGTKEDLFVAAHRLPVSPARVIRALREPGPGSPGAELARLYLEAAFTEPLESLIRAAMTNATARSLLREFIERGLLDAIEPVIGAGEARLRMGLAASHLVGLFLARNVIGIDVLRDTDEDRLVEIVGATLDRYLTMSLDPEPGR